MFHPKARVDMLSSLITDARRSPEASSGFRRALLYGAHKGPVNGAAGVNTRSKGRLDPRDAAPACGAPKPRLSRA